MEIIGHYRAYMLRMWSVEQSGQAVWMASLEDPHTGERLGFSNVEALIVYLRELTGNSQNEEERLRDNEPRA
jgi:hypothetical protein